MISKYSGKEVDDFYKANLLFMTAYNNCNESYNWINLDWVIWLLLVGLCFILYFALLIFITRFLSLNLFIWLIVFLTVFVSLLFYTCYPLVNFISRVTAKEQQFYGSLLSYIFSSIFIIISIINYRYKSKIKTILVSILPFAISCFCITSIVFIDYVNLIDLKDYELEQKVYRKMLLLSSILYLPFLGLLTQRFKNQLSLPKEK